MFRGFDQEAAVVRLVPRIRSAADDNASLLLKEVQRLRNVIRTGGALYRAERVTMGIPGGIDPNEEIPELENEAADVAPADAKPAVEGDESTAEVIAQQAVRIERLVSIMHGLFRCLEASELVVNQAGLFIGPAKTWRRFESLPRVIEQLVRQRNMAETWRSESVLALVPLQKAAQAALDAYDGNDGSVASYDAVAATMEYLREALQAKDTEKTGSALPVQEAVV